MPPLGQQSAEFNQKKSADTGDRVIALRSAVKSIAEADSGDLAKFIGVSSLRPFINNELILAELLEFSIPGTQFSGRGMTTEHFEMICRGYVQALYEKASLTERQRDIAIKCAVLTAGLTRTGLDALIDEATGYQYERAEDALQVKLGLFIAEELRAWEKTDIVTVVEEWEARQAIFERAEQGGR